MSEEAGKQQFEINCASRGFHVYRNLWSPKFGQILQVKQELGNVHDPFEISLFYLFIYLFHIFKEGSPSAYIKTDFQGALRPKI